MEEAHEGTNIYPPSLTILPKAGPTHVHFPAISSSHLCRLETHSAGSPAIPSMAGILAEQWQWAGAQTLLNDFWIVLTSKKPLPAGLISPPPPPPPRKLLMWMGITTWHKTWKIMCPQGWFDSYWSVHLFAVISHICFGHNVLLN